MRYSARQLARLGAILCAAWGVVAGVWADERGAERISAATTTRLADPNTTLDYVFIDIHTNAAGEVVTMDVGCRDITLKKHVAADGRVSYIEMVIYIRTATFPSRDWQRALDRHLGKVRMEYSRTRSVLTFCNDGPPQGSLRSEILDIVKRRGFIFDPDPPRQTGYVRPAPTGI